MFSPVPSEIWQFEVSGLRVLQSWLGYRMAKGKGRKIAPRSATSPLGDALRCKSHGRATTNGVNPAVTV
ncbi:MAG: type ISP restriction/modification enzyme [Actinomycetota bacterium]